MKKMSKKSVLLWLVLLWTVALIWFVSALVINIDDSIDLHKVRLHSLYLWSGDEESDYAKIYMDGDEAVLRIWSWLMIWGLDVGVAWGGTGNKIDWDNSDFIKVIGWWWWLNNYVLGEDWGAVVWWYDNEANAWWVVVWWYENRAWDSTVIWWFNNVADNYSLVFWSDAAANYNSFSWNTDMRWSISNAASISAKSWVLIWTYAPITGVNLVVSWAVKFGWEEINEWDSGYRGEIRAVSWCFYAYDGASWHVINDWDISSCGNFMNMEWACKFGNVWYLSWDTVLWYEEPYSSDCTPLAARCKWGKFYKEPGLSEEVNIYPYCYWGHVVNDWWSGQWDFNNDGEFNISDINFFFNYCKSLILWWGYDDICDLNEDGEVNNADTNRFIDYMLNFL